MQYAGISADEDYKQYIELLGHGQSNQDGTYQGIDDGTCYMKFVIKATGDVPVMVFNTGDWELFDIYWDVDEF